MWPKLQLQQEKPHWLRLDFDLMQESSDEGENDDDNRSSLDKEVNILDNKPDDQNKKGDKLKVHKTKTNKQANSYSLTNCNSILVNK